MHLENPFEPEYSLEVDTHIYPKQAIVRTSYALSNNGKFWIQDKSDGVLVVKIKSTNPELSIQQLCEEFSSALIDFTLRLQIEEKTKSIREAIVSSALAEAIKG
jgi:His-Xaa-Ser system protein HxsD